MTRAALFLIIPVAVLFSFGLLMIFNTTAAQIIDSSLEMDTRTVLIKQLCYGVVGVCLGIAVYVCGYEALLRYSIPALLIGVFLLVLLFVPGIGQTINGARRWIGVFGVTFQPSECIKILVPAAYIHWSLQREKIALVPFLKMLGCLSIPLALILLEPDNGTTAIIFSVAKTNEYRLPEPKF